MSRKLISEIQFGKRVRQDPGEIDSLAKSIDRWGLLQPVLIGPDNSLGDGWRRCEAWQLLGRKSIPIPVYVHDFDRIARREIEIEANLRRKQFSWSEKVAIYQAVRPRIEAEAEQRKKSRLKRGQESSDQETCLIGTKGQTRDLIAAYCGEASGRTLEKAVAVIESGDPNLIARLNKTGRVDGVFKLLQTQLEAERVAKELPPLPTGPFRVIVADPAWRYDKDAWRCSRSAPVYPTMIVEEIKQVDVPSLAHEDCILWLWATNSHMAEALSIVEHWGFRQKTILTWDKETIGLGDWLRGQTEHCILAVRGKPTTTLTNQTTVLRAPRGRHSQKPDEFYRLVESLCPGSKVELFARAKREGWVTHGILPVK
jgi:N6-adenosine-specific RNA methylase IME4